MDGGSWNGKVVFERFVVCGVVGCDCDCIGWSGNWCCSCSGSVYGRRWGEWYGWYGWCVLNYDL